MNTAELLARLRQLDVRVWVENNELRLSAPKNVLDDELRGEIRYHKTQIIEALSTARSALCTLEPRIEHVEPRDDYPLSFAQERLWFLSRLMEDSSAYNFSYKLRLTGALNADVLERSLNEIIARHGSLRTRFTTAKNGKPRQHIDPHLSIQLSREDLQHYRGPNQDEELQRHLREDTKQPFCLESGPLIRATLFRLDEDDYLLLLNMHHIVSDGWSIDILLREIEKFYQALSQGKDQKLPSLSIQYTDFATWQREQLSEKTLEDQMNYWQEQLTAVSTLQLPTDHSRPNTQTFRGSQVVRTLSPELSQHLDAFSQKEDATLFMILLAVFNVLLHRYSGQDDIVVGSPVANRMRPELETLIGFFVNMVVLRTNMSGDPDFHQLLSRVKEMALGAYQHQEVPFEILVDMLKPTRDLSRNPLFQVSFSLHNAPLEPPVLEGVKCSHYFSKVETTRFDIEAHLGQDENGLMVRFVYNPDLFEATTIERMLSHYETLLEGIMSAPNTRISHLPLLTTAEHEKIVNVWNRTENEYARDASVQQLFEAQVASTPNAVAIVSEGEELSYGQLNEQANRLANFLIEQGVATDIPVAVLMQRSPELIIAQLAALKAGGAYIPIDPDYPTQRLAFILKDTGTPVLLTQSSLLAKIPDYSGRSLCLDTEEQQLKELSEENPVVHGQSEDLAYVIYTSGSTGEPKGVEVSHGGLSNLVFWHSRAYQLSSVDRATHLAGLGFDASIWELWPYLSTGGCIHLVPEEIRLSPARLWSWMASHGITLSFLPTPLAEAALKEPLPTDLSLRVLLTGGDRLHSGLINNELPFSVVNHYGPSENTVVASCAEVDFMAKEEPSIGRPIDNVQIYILDQHQQPTPVGVPGELYIGGDSLARGYLNRPELTVEKFVLIPFIEKGKGRLYRTGDIARYRVDGSIDFIGRVDHQVKLRGFRIELGEIEAVLNRQPGIESTVVLLREDVPGDKRLVAYVVTGEDQALSKDGLQRVLLETLPAFMVPAAFVFLDKLPLTSNGKVNKDALPAPDGGRHMKESYIAPKSDVEMKIANIWKDVLKIDQVSVHDSFFSLGGNSLLLAQVHERIQQVLDNKFAILDLFKYPTISTFAAYLSGKKSTEDNTSTSKSEHAQKDIQQHEPIAIIGMAGKFPGAEDVEAFWRNLRDGIESITFLTNEELREAGVPDSILEDPSYVGAVSRMNDPDMFDAQFFGYTPRQAQIIDPQHRVFLECAWEVMERAAYNPDRYQGQVAVYGGASVNDYTNALVLNQALAKSFTYLDTHMGNDKDFLTTRISYNLNLKGPGITLQTSCSTSLVATHLAIRSLQEHDCDMAIAGGTAIRNYKSKGYKYQQGGILSSDGHCRAFDTKANGTISGDGTAVVLLKRLDDALADGDQIYAVIKGSAINNDGSQKAGYTVPGVQGQAEAVRAAQAQAGIDPRSITYVETHGTGTTLGDPIEIAALTQAFHEQTQDTNFCAIGSLKTNVGHMESAAGVGGLIKTTLALWHKQLPPSLHYHEPNPEIDFVNSPFFVNAKLTPWGSDASPRRAGVSSFGIGGTNAHVILEEAPAIEPSSMARPWQLLVLSSKTVTALDTMTDNLNAYLQCNPQVNLADLAYTLQVGRKEFNYRRTVVCRDVADAVEVLKSKDPRRVMGSVVKDTATPVVFMFTGQGSQYPNMGLHLYQYQSHYKEIVDQCCDILHDHLDFDLREALFPSEKKFTQATMRLNQTEVTQLALFVTEYALARLWMSWGIVPAAMIGHSIGEYVAACLSGVMSLEAALELVATRGRLMGQLPKGSMMAVPLSEAELAPMLSENLEVATINGPQMCVVSGTDEVIDAFAAQLYKKGIQTHILHTSHAFHSAMMEPVLEPFTDCVSTVALEPPQIPYISNVTGTWITQEDATRANYYSTHLRSAVRFADGLEQLFSEPECLLLEVGPGHTLSSLAKHHPARQDAHVIVSSLRHVTEEQSDEAFLWQSIGKLWLAGGYLDWAAMHHSERRLRILLPTYPFERQRYWLDQNNLDTTYEQRKDITGKINEPGQWCYLPVWKSSQVIDQDVRDDSDYSGRWLMFQDQYGLGEQLASRIEDCGGDIIRVIAGEQFNNIQSGLYELNPASRDDYQLLFDVPELSKLQPSRIIHAWALGHNDALDLNTALDLGYYSLLFLVQALEKRWPVPQMHIDVITDNAQSVTGDEKLCPEKTFGPGLCKVLPIEYPAVSCRHIDIELPESALQLDPFMISGLLGELGGLNESKQLAFRSGRRWLLEYQRANPDNLTKSPRLRDKGAYLITGGVGGVGMALAEHLAKTVNARLILTSRSELPPRSSWDELLSKHDDNDVTTRRIRKLRKLEEMGAELIVAAVDVADRNQMQYLIAKAHKQFGSIHGVIHAAGVVSGPSLDLIQNMTREKCELQFHPKVHGLLVLKELFEDLDLDFLMPISSISAVLGGLGFAAYAAANQFMDALSMLQHNRGHRNWISVDWDGWDFDGKGAQSVTEGTTASFALTTDEGCKAFNRVLHMGALPLVVISTGDLKQRIEQWISHDEQQGTDVEDTVMPAVYARPALVSDYAEPHNDTEQKLAEIWQNALGIEKVGINDNFFELGGDSVLNIQIIAMATKAGLKLTPKDAFEHQTIAELAMVADAKLATELEPGDGTDENIDVDISENDLAEILRQQEL